MIKKIIILHLVHCCCFSPLWAQFTNLGKLNILANTYLVASGTIQNSGSVAILSNNGTIKSAIGIENENTALYKGTGSASGAIFTNNATVAPGNSPGCMAFSNGYANNHLLEIELGGTAACDNFDKLSITGTATLSGTLNATTINGFVGLSGDELTIIDANSLVGTFSTVNLPQDWEINYNYPSTGQVTLTLGRILPLELLDFKARLSNNTTLLTWKTTNEENTLRFDVERSINGIDFEKIGTVAAKNTSGNHSYSFKDKNLGNQSIWYYRLRQNDRDGQFEYSKIQSVVQHGIETETLYLTLYPNPTTSDLNLFIDLEYDIPIVARLFDMTGKLVRSFSFQYNFTRNNLLDLHELVSGTYTLQLLNADWEQLVIRQFVKL